MSEEQEPGVATDPAQALASEDPAGVEIEILDGVPMLNEVRAIDRVRTPKPPAVAIAQSAAVAATGFIAGAATAALLGRRMGRQLARARAGAALPPQPQPQPQPRGELVEIVATRTFLVNVHVLARRTE